MQTISILALVSSVLSAILPANKQCFTSCGLASGIDLKSIIDVKLFGIDVSLPVPETNESGSSSENGPQDAGTRSLLDGLLLVENGLRVQTPQEYAEERGISAALFDNSRAVYITIDSSSVTLASVTAISISVKNDADICNFPLPLEVISYNNANENSLVSAIVEDTPQSQLIVRLLEIPLEDLPKLEILVIIPDAYFKFEQTVDNSQTPPTVVQKVASSIFTTTLPVTLGDLSLLPLPEIPLGSRISRFLANQKADAACSPCDFQGRLLKQIEDASYQPSVTKPQMQCIRNIVECCDQWDSVCDSFKTCKKPKKCSVIEPCFENSICDAAVMLSSILMCASSDSACKAIEKNFCKPCKAPSMFDQFIVNCSIVLNSKCDSVQKIIRKFYSYFVSLDLMIYPASMMNFKEFSPREIKAVADACSRTFEMQVLGDFESSEHSTQDADAEMVDEEETTEEKKSSSKKGKKSSSGSPFLIPSIAVGAVVVVAVVVYIFVF